MVTAMRDKLYEDILAALDKLGEDSAHTFERCVNELLRKLRVQSSLLRFRHAAIAAPGAG